MTEELRSPAVETPRPRQARVRAIVLIPVLVLVALAAWVFASPVGSSPDDDFHLASIWCANPFNTTSCLTGDEPGERIVPDLIANAPVCYQFEPLVSAECQYATLDFSSEPTELTTRGSFGNNYPPVYYLAMSLFVGPNIVVSVLIMRLVNVLLFVGLSTALYALLPARLKSPFAWSWLVSIVPLGAFLIASNNPSAWALIGVGTVWAALLGYFEASGRRRVGLAIIFAAGTVLAAGSRADSAIYTVVAIGAVMFLAFVRSRGYLVRSILPLALALVALGFYITSGQSAVATDGLGSVDDLPTERALSSLITANLVNVVALFVGAFGSWALGWLDVALPPIVAFGAGLTYVSVVFTGLAVAWWRKNLVVAGVGALLVVLPVYVLIRGGNVVGEVLQPRYLLPLLLLFAALALLPRHEERLHFSAPQVVFLSGGLVVANAIALHVNIRRYVSGEGVSGINLDSPAGWWWDGFPISPMGVWALGTASFAGAVIMLVRELQRRAIAPSGEAAMPLKALD